MNPRSLPLWRITGTGRRGGDCVVKVRAGTHAQALSKAARYGCVTVASCVLVEEGRSS